MPRAGGGGKAAVSRWRAARSSRASRSPRMVISMELPHAAGSGGGPGVLVELLGRGLPADRVITDPDVLAALSRVDAEWAPAGMAAAGIRARSEAEVQHVVRTCAE